jgi:exonuclease VII small subunit
MGKAIIAALLALILVLGVVGVGVYYNQPKVAAREALIGAIEDLGDRDEIAPIVNMFKKGSLEVSGTVKSELTDLEDDINFGGKFYFADKEFMAENIFFKMGKDYDYAIDQAYGSKDLVYISSDSILDGTLGIIKGETADAFEKWDLIEDLEIPEEAVKAITAIFEAYDDGEFDDIDKDIKKIADKYEKFIIKTIEDNAEYEAETESVKVGGDKMDARVITVTIDGEAMVAIVEALCEEIVNDDELRDTVEKYVDIIQPALDEAGLLEDDMDVMEYYDDAMEELEDAVKDIDDEIPEDVALVLEVVTPKFIPKLMKLNVITVEDDKEMNVLTLDLGKDGMKKTNHIEVSVSDDYATVIYDISENSKSAYEAELSFEMNSAEVTVATIEINKDKDTFEFAVPMAELVVTGDWVTDGGETAITLDEIKVGDETIDGVTVKLVINEKDKMPKPLDKGDVKNIFETKMEDFEKIVEKLGIEGAKEDTGIIEEIEE